MAEPPEGARPDRTRRSLALSALDTYVGLVLGIASRVLLARLLVPDDFGVFAVAAVFASLAGSIRTFGTNEYLIQHPAPTTATWRAAGAVVWIVGWTLGIALIVLSPWVARFYGRDEVGHVLVVLALGYFFTPLGSVTLAWCRRELRMAPVVASSLAANLATFVVGLVFAMRGHGAMSLAIATVAGAAASTLVVLAMRPAHLPRWPSLEGAGEVLRFGRQASGIFLYGQAGAGAPELVIGKAEGLVPVAHFGRAQGLVELFNHLVLKAVGPVMLPALAQRARAGADHGGIAAVYLRGTGHLTALAWPILGGMAILAWPAVRIVYGAQWMQAVPIAPVLCLAAAVAMAQHLASALLFALGLVRECNVLELKVQLLRVAGTLLVLPFGLVGACWGLVAAALAGAWLTQRAVRAAAGVTVGALWQATRKSAAVAVCSLLPVAVLVAWLPPDEGNYLRVGGAGAVLLVLGWLAALKALAHPLWLEVTSLACTARGFVRRRR